MYARNQFPKQCGCGAVYSREAWRLLPAIGVTSGTVNGVRYTDDVELRNCSCNNTLAVSLAGHEGSSWRAALVIMAFVVMFSGQGCTPYMLPDQLAQYGEPKGELLELYDRVVDCLHAPHIIPPRVQFVTGSFTCGNTERAIGCSMRNLSLVIVDIRALNYTNGAVWSHEIVHYIMPGQGHDIVEMETCGRLTFKDDRI